MISVIFFTLLPIVHSAPPSVSGSAAGSASESQIQVTLFGQPCVMKGPVQNTVLEALHAMSPERIRPNLSISEMERIKATAAKASGLSPGMTLYRDHLVKRLSARISFDASLKQLQRRSSKRPSPDVLLKNVKEHISPIRFDDFRARVEKQFSENKGGALSEVFLIKLKDEYEQFIQPDTEEEFHKTIKASQVRYECHFGEEADAEEEEES